jgi:hypothetical protein
VNWDDIASELENRLSGGKFLHNTRVRSCIYAKLANLFIAYYDADQLAALSVAKSLLCDSSDTRAVENIIAALHAKLDLITQDSEKTEVDSARHRLILGVFARKDKFDEDDIEHIVLFSEEAGLTPDQVDQIFNSCFGGKGQWSKPLYLR